ncbi:hypothetical protein JRI60_47585 [Archangium violaceum]|uniref:hypothetical protein n=1 Tax=Archangium violaceum TaxID=83451 RepID=UPI0019523497|nr:hypothetical protein [Archangium violaceum]QRN96583.1 hypothetical protein JRI60_47585 [Archangium violaceum]
MDDVQRLKDLKKDPSLFDQGPHGSCGFAGTLMGLLIHDPSKVDDLYKTISQGSEYLGVKESVEVKNRLKKRLDAGVINDQANNFLDVRMSLGLMIILKEYLREKKQDQIWEDCRKYSLNFKDYQQNPWVYGDKLKDLQQNALNVPDFAYKHGDLALTIPAMEALLGMVGFKSISTTSLVSNEDVVRSGKNLRMLFLNQSLKDNLKKVVNKVDDGTYAGAMVGVAYKPFIGQAVHKPHQYIGHWVYLPKPIRFPPVDVARNVVWTWGKQLNLNDLLKEDMVPKAVVTFEKQ